MAVRLLTAVRWRELTAAGLPAAGYKLYSFAAGTSTPQAIFTDPTGATAHPQPAIFDSEGFLDVWLTEGIGYKFRVDTNLDVVRYTKDNILIPTVLTTSTLPAGITMAVATGVFAASNNAAVLTLPGFLQANKLYLGIGLVVDTPFGNGNGLVTLAIGESGILDRWGSGIALTAASTNGARKNSIFAPQSAQDLILTAQGGLFAATGQATATRYEITLA